MQIHACHGGIAEKAIRSVFRIIFQTLFRIYFYLSFCNLYIYVGFIVFSVSSSLWSCLISPWICHWIWATKRKEYIRKYLSVLLIAQNRWKSGLNANEISYCACFNRWNAWYCCVQMSEYMATWVTLLALSSWGWYSQYNTTHRLQIIYARCQPYLF